MDAGAERNKGSLQFLVGELGSLWNKGLMSGEPRIDLAHKAVNGLAIWAAPLVVGQEKSPANERFMELWGKLPASMKELSPAMRERITDDDLFDEYRRQKQMEAYACLYYDHGILSKQDVPTYDATRED